jgi:hypothetical protein
MRNTGPAYGPAPAQTFTSPPSMVPAAVASSNPSYELGGISSPSPRIVELPWPLVRRQLPTLAPLYARSDQITGTIALWSSRDGETYEQQAIGAARYSVLGKVAADYPAETPLIDETVGMLVNWSGADRVEGVTDDDAAALTWLAFVGDEIISVRDINIVSPIQVRLTGHRRGVCGTPRQAFPAGTNILFIRRDQLAQFSDPFRYRFGTSWWWKIQPVFFNRFLPLDECLPLPAAMTLQAVTCRPASHVNLRVNGASANATFTWGDDIAVAWDLADWRAEAFWMLFSTPFAPRDIGSKISVVAADDRVVRSVLLEPGISTWTYTAAAVAADFGAPPASFRVRVSALWDGFESARFQEVNVTS